MRQINLNNLSTDVQTCYLIVTQSKAEPTTASNKTIELSRQAKNKKKTITKTKFMLV